MARQVSAYCSPRVPAFGFIYLFLPGEENSPETQVKYCLLSKGKDWAHLSKTKVQQCSPRRDIRDSFMVFWALEDISSATSLTLPSTACLIDPNQLHSTPAVVLGGHLVVLVFP